MTYKDKVFHIAVYNLAAQPDETTDSAHMNNESDSKNQPDDRRQAQQNVLRISNIPPEMAYYTLIMTLENRKKSGGGEVEKLKFDPGSDTAIVSYKSADGTSQIPVL